MFNSQYVMRGGIMGGIWVELHVIPPIIPSLHKSLIINVVMPLRWKGGITNDKKYFS